jgi:long-chain acyl-CoA synthetase
VGSLRTLGSLVDALAGYGDRTALLALHADGVEEWSYATLSDWVARLASGLASAGVGPGDRVALLAGPRPGWIAASLAALRAGAVAVPLDVQLGDDALGRILADSGARLVFTTADQTDRLHARTGARLVLLDAGADDERSWKHLLVEGPAELPRPSPEDPAVLFYTSGTTGAPKGALLNHRNIAFQLNTVSDAALVGSDDRVLLPLPLHHVYPFVIGMLLPMALGLPVILPQSLTGPQIVRALREGRVTAIVGVPRLYAALYSGIIARSESRGRAVAALLRASIDASARLRRYLGLRLGKLLFRPLHKEFGPTLRLLASGGAALDPQLAWRLEGLGWQVAIGYGLTETSPLLTINPPGTPRLDSVGRAIPGVELSIDTSAPPDEARRQGGSREAGEILARGPNVFAGYHNLPDQTSAAFKDGWLRTGDLGYFDEEHYLYVLGRGSELIVLASGENLQPEEVEEVYLQSPLIREIGVLQREGRLVALIAPELSEVGRRGIGLGQAIREAVAERSRALPSHQRITDYALTRKPLPHTSLGKLRRHLLPERYESAGQGEHGLGEALAPISVDEMSEEDRALLEDAVAKSLWDWLAGRYSNRRLTPDSSLQFDLGVDSLEWVDLTLDIGRRTGVELGEAAIGSIETVRDLLREVSTQAATGEAVPQLPSLDEPEAALSGSQRRWLEPLGPAESAMASALHALDRALLRHFFRLRVEGLERLPDGGQLVLAPNHASYLDALVVAATLDDRRLEATYWAGWTGATFGNPLSRLLSRLTRVVPIDHRRALFSSLAFGAAVLKRGKHLVWFPEGRRSPSGQLQPFKPGIGMLLAHHPVPVVPVFISGAYEAWQPGRLRICPRRITIVFGEPLDPRDLERQGEGEQSHHRIAHGLHEAVARLGERATARHP